MEINWIKCIWDKGKHNAFTDLCTYRGRLFCSFREAKNHVSPDGLIRILELNTQGEVINSCALRMTNVDLRDPKLSVDPGGKLILIAYARYHDENGIFQYSHPLSWFSNDGKSWSSARQFGDKNWWLWRISWLGNKALGFAYNRRQQAVTLYHGHPRRTFEILKKEALSQQRHNLGYPNESDIVFAENLTAFALVRRDADTCTAQLGTALPPYTQWKWHSLPEYIGGPAMILINDDTALIAGRLWRRSGPKTAIWTLSLTTKALDLELVLPSGGDTSYPGLHREGSQLFVSYYSSHVNHKSNIFMANITLEE